MGNLKDRDFTFLKLYNLPPSGKGQAPVFDVFEAFLNTDNIQVFANAATSYIMCLMKFVKGLGKWSPPFLPPDSWGPSPGWLCVNWLQQASQHPGIEAHGAMLCAQKHKAYCKRSLDSVQG